MTERELRALLDECAWALERGVWPYVDALRVADILGRIRGEDVKAGRRPIP